MKIRLIDLRGRFSNRCAIYWSVFGLIAKWWGKETQKGEDDTMCHWSIHQVTARRVTLTAGVIKLANSVMGLHKWVCTAAQQSLISCASWHDTLLLFVSVQFTVPLGVKRHCQLPLIVRIVFAVARASTFFACRHMCCSHQSGGHIGVCKKLFRLLNCRVTCCWQQWQLSISIPVIVFLLDHVSRLLSQTIPFKSLHRD